MMHPYAEYEMGFTHLVHKLTKLAQEAGADMILYSSRKTFDVFEKELSKIKSSQKIQHRLLLDPEDHKSVFEQVNRNDLFIAVSARKGTISYEPFLENLPSRLNRYFKDKNFVLIYPEQHAMTMKETGYQPQDVTLAPIQEQLENLTRIGKAMRRIFSAKRNEKREEDAWKDDDKAEASEWPDTEEKRLEE